MRNILAVLLLSVAVIHAASESSVSRYGVTFNFSASRPVGQFANGDWWVQAPVTITSMTPNWNGNDNGWEVNPRSGSSRSSNQGFTTREWYQSNLRPGLPFTVNVSGGTYSSPCTIVKTIGTGSAKYPFIQTAVALTVLDDPPADGTGAGYFRPPYCGTEKPLVATTAIRFDKLPSLAPVPNMVSISSIETYHNKGLWMQHSHGRARQMRPTAALLNYGPDNARRIFDSFYRCMMNDSLSAKSNMVMLVTQWALDEYYVLKDGLYFSGTGHDNNRMIPAAWAAVMLDLDKGFLNQVSPGSPGSNECYHEQAYIHWTARTNPQRGLWGRAAPAWSTYNTMLFNYHRGIKKGDRSYGDPDGYIDGGPNPPTMGGYFAITLQGYIASVTIGQLIPEIQSCFQAPIRETISTSTTRFGPHTVWDAMESFATRSKFHGCWTSPDPSGGMRTDGDFIGGHGQYADGTSGGPGNVSARMSAYMLAMSNRYMSETGVTLQSADIAVVNHMQAHDWGNVVTNTINNRTITVTNQDDTVSGEWSASVSGTGFSLVGTTSGVLSPESSASFTLRFAPPGFGTFTGLLSYGGTNLTGLNSSLTGRADPPEGPKADLEVLMLPATQDYGEVVTNTVNDVSFVITNKSDTISGEWSVAATGTGFSIDGTDSGVLSASSQTTITSRFVPTAVGSYSGTLTFGGTNLLDVVASLSGKAGPIVETDTAINAHTLLIVAPMVTNAANWIEYPSGAVTGPSTAGRAIAFFTVPTNTEVRVFTTVNAETIGDDSFFVQIDAEPADPSGVWDVTPITSGFESRPIQLRAQWTNQIPTVQLTNVWTLNSNATHKLIILTRENGTQLRDITIQLGGAVPMDPLPGIAGDPDPEDGATEVLPAQDFFWSEASNATTYNFYFATNDTPVLIQSGLTTPGYTVGVLPYSTNFNWRVDTVNPSGTTTGDVWTFSTTDIEDPPPGPRLIGLRPAKGVKNVRVGVQGGVGVLP